MPPADARSRQAMSTIAKDTNASTAAPHLEPAHRDEAIEIGERPRHRRARRVRRIHVDERASSTITR